MEKGHQYYKAGNFEAALKEFGTATKIDPGHLESWENMGWAHLKMGHADQAIEIWTNLRDVHPDRSRLLNMIAEAHVSKQEYEQALSQYEDSLNVKPDQEDVHAAICRVLYWAGHYREVILHCQESLSSYPNRDDIRRLLVEVQIRPEIGEYQASIDHWQDLIVKKPDEIELHVGLTTAFYYSESFPEAFEAAQQILVLDPKHIFALDIALKSALQMQDYQMAEDAVEALRNAEPNHPEVRAGQAKIHNGMALRFYKHGEFERALEEFLTAQTLATDLFQLKENIGWTYRRMGNVDDAIRVWEGLIDDREDNVRVLNFLAGAYGEKKLFKKALLTYNRSLEIDPTQYKIRFARAQIKRWIGRYRESEAELSRLVAEYPENTLMRYNLCLCLMRLRRYEEAAKHFEQLLFIHPDNPEYILAMARALYFSEQYDDALKLAYTVLEKDPANLDALDFLADDKVFRGEYRNACGFLNKALTIDGNDVTRLNRLADCAASVHEFITVRNATRQSLDRLDAQPTIHLLHAESLRFNGLPDEAIRRYEHVLTLNPNNIPALHGLIECCMSKKDYKKGLAYLDRIIAIDETNIYHLIEKARLLSYMREHGQSIELLEDLLQKVSRRKIFLVLLYHGISKNQRSNTTSLSDFKAHMNVLSELNYSAVTTQDLIDAWKGEIDLPSRSVLVTFDDGKRNSFECADPVFRELSFKGTMFVAACVTDANDPDFSDWNEIKSYTDKQWWDIQSHGNNAHYSIPVSPANERQRFLTHKQWLTKEGRLESDHEYFARIESDYLESKEILENRLNITVNAMAFPYGDLGQMEYADSRSVSSNLTSVRQYFSLAFVQDKYGFNLVGDNPYLLKRVEPHKDWTARKLREHIEKNNPVRLIKMNLATIYTWAGLNNRAVGLYNEVLDVNPKDQNVLLAKAEACKKSGRFIEARTALDQVLDMNSTHPTAMKERRRVDKLAVPEAKPFISYFDDNDDRRLVKRGVSLRLHQSDKLTLEPSFTRTVFDDKNVPEVNGNEYSLRALYRRDEIDFDLSYTYRDFSRARNAHNYSVMATLPFLRNDITNVKLTHAYKNKETAAAALRGIRYYENAIYITHSLSERIYAEGGFRRLDFTDDNTWNNFRLSGFYRFHDQPRLFAGCEFALDDTNFRTPAYYAPDQLTTLLAVFRAENPVSDRLTYALQYAIGPAWEQGNANQNNPSEAILQQGTVSLNLQASDSLEFGLSADFLDTPTYASKYILFDLKYRF